MEHSTARIALSSDAKAAEIPHSPHRLELDTGQLTLTVNDDAGDAWIEVRVTLPRVALTSSPPTLTLMR